MTTAIAPTPRHALRAATAADHARLDALLGGGLRSHDDYATYVVGLHAFLRDAAQALAAQPPSPAWQVWGQADRVEWLERDLDWLRLAPLPAAAPAVSDSDAAAAGLLYVIEGSTLGARLLVRDAVRLGLGPGRGATFLHHHAGDGALARWRGFVAALDAARFDDHQARTLHAAAGSTFQRAEAAFRRARIHAGDSHRCTA